MHFYLFCAKLKSSIKHLRCILCGLPDLHSLYNGVFLVLCFFSQAPFRNCHGGFTWNMKLISVSQSIIIMLYLYIIHEYSNFATKKMAFLYHGWVYLRKSPCNNWIRRDSYTLGSWMGWHGASDSVICQPCCRQNLKYGLSWQPVRLSHCPLHVNLSRIQAHTHPRYRRP